MLPARVSLRFALVLVLVGWSGTGCQSGTTPRMEASFVVPRDTLAPPTAAERDSALARLRTMQRTAFDSAFVRMRTYRFTRHQRTEHLTPRGAIAALHERMLRYTSASESPTIVASDSVGPFPQPVLSTFGPENDIGSMPANVAPDAFPEDAAYLSPRTQDDFRYWLRSDTLDGVSVDKVIIRPTRSPTGREQAVRYAHVLIDPSSGNVLEAYTQRSSQVLLFREESRLFVRLRRAPDGTWVPHLARFHTLVDLPFRAPRTVRTVSAYANYAHREADAP